MQHLKPFSIFKEAYVFAWFLQFLGCIHTAERTYRDSLWIKTSANVCWRVALLQVRILSGISRGFTLKVKVQPGSLLPVQMHVCASELVNSYKPFKNVHTRPRFGLKVFFISHKSKTIPTSLKFTLFFIQPLTNQMSWVNLTNIEFHLCSIFFHGFIWEQPDETESHENAGGWFGLIFRPFHRFFITLYNSITIIISLTFPLTTLNTILWVKSWIYKEEEYEKPLIGHAFEITMHAD